MSLLAIDSLNIIGYYGEMELSLAEKKLRIVMAAAFYEIIQKYYAAVHTIIADKKTDERRKNILLAAAVVSLKRAYRGFFDKYYERYVNTLCHGGEPYYGIDAWRNKHALDFSVWLMKTARNEPGVAFGSSHTAAVTRTEINAIGNLAALDAAYRRGERFKTWKTFGDGRVRPSHRAVNGTRIPIDEAFKVGGYLMMFPNDSSLGAGAEEVVNCRCVLEFDDGKRLTNGNERGIIKLDERGVELVRTDYRERLAAGNRRSPFYVLSDEDIAVVKQEIVAIGADENEFVFNSESVRGTCFLARDGMVHIKGNIFPDNYSDHPRDRMSVRAVLAHEYYGHRPNRQQYLIEDSVTSDEERNRLTSLMWADEFRASYMAAKNAPGLTDEDRQYLIMDAISRAKEAGVSIRYNDFMRRVLYG